MVGDRGTRKEPDTPEPVLIPSKGILNLSVSFKILNRFYMIFGAYFVFT